MNAYELKGIEKNSDKFLLKIGRLSLKAGKVYSLVGPNGSGKTTLLNILSFVDSVLKGKVFFENRLVDYRDSGGLLKLRRRISYLLQHPYLFNMSVFDNVGYGLKIRGLDKKIINKKVEDILFELSLSHLAKRNVRLLSRGEAQRVALARALILDADVYLLDEPMANVDKENIRTVEELILSLNRKRSATIILSTHLQQQAYRISKDIIFMLDGQIKEISYENVFSGSVEEDKDGFKSVVLKNGLRLNVSNARGSRAMVAIDPQNIILSKERIASSALNSFQGTINKLEHMNGSLRVFVDAGVDFCALITHKSFVDMGLNIGQKAWITFKANSIKVI